MLTLFSLKLYTTSNCHLCEQAEALLKPYPNQLTLVEISDDDKLLTLYGTRIPVLQREDNFAELDWPFNANDITKFIND